MAWVWAAARSLCVANFWFSCSRVYWRFKRVEAASALGRSAVGWGLGAGDAGAEVAVVAERRAASSMAARLVRVDAILNRE
jgi:hypothetical protein